VADAGTFDGAEPLIILAVSLRVNKARMHAIMVWMVEINLDGG